MLQKSYKRNLGKLIIGGFFAFILVIFWGWFPTKVWREKLDLRRFIEPERQFSLERVLGLAVEAVNSPKGQKFVDQGMKAVNWVLKTGPAVRLKSSVVREIEKFKKGALKLPESQVKSIEEYFCRTILEEKKGENGGN